MASEVEKNLGTVTAFGYAKSKGYTGTEEEFAQLMADYAEVGQQAAEAAYQAKLSEQSAAASKEASRIAATNAANAKQAAETAQQTAESKATEASSSAIDAADARDDAQLAKQRAEEAKDSAEEYEASAKQAADQAQAYAAAYYALLPTDTASGSVASFPDGADGIPVKDLTVQILPQQAGSGDPSPDNVRPISGWFGASIWRTGKNLFNKNDYLRFNGYFNSPSNGTIVPSSSHTIVYFPCSPGQTYTVSRLRAVSEERLMVGFCAQPPAAGVAYFGASSVPNSGIVGNRMVLTATAPSEAKYLAIWAWWQNSVNLEDTLQVELGSTASAYEPYEGGAYSISWAAEAGSVYGGTLDVTTGLLTVTHVKTTPTGGTWSNPSVFSISTNSTWMPAPMRSGSWQNDAKTMANCLEKGARDVSGQKPTILFGANNNYIYIYNQTVLDGVTDYATMIAWMADNLEITYPLATPITYQLTPTEVTTLLGVNNIWADTGDSAVTYRADTKKYIDKRLSSAGG